MTCPSDYELIEGSISSKIPIYILEEDIPPTDKKFDGKAGDVIVGGGAGMEEAMRISIPEAVNYLKIDGSVFFQSPVTIFRSYWGSNFMLRLANGFTKVGLDFDKSSVEMWILWQVIGWLKDEHPSYLQSNADGIDFNYKNDLFSA